MGLSKEDKKRKDSQSVSRFLGLFVCVSFSSFFFSKKQLERVKCFLFFFQNTFFFFIIIVIIDIK